MNNLIWKKQTAFAGFIKSFKQYGLRDTMRGVGAYLWRQILYLTYPIYLPFLKKKGGFILKGKKYMYCLEKYNLAWRNERTIEIPIVQKLIKENSKSNMLEIGCVLKHYETSPKIGWTIIDKYEIFDGVINTDIIEYKPKKLFDLVFSVSTFEHVGMEDGAVSQNKAKKAIEHIVNNCLKKNGQFVFTVPVGYNKRLDKQIFNNEINITEKHYFARIPGNNWLEVTKDQILDSVYNKPYVGANALFIGLLNK